MENADKKMWGGFITAKCRRGAYLLLGSGSLSDKILKLGFLKVHFSVFQAIMV